jgi:hypothetical protein
MNTTAAKNNDSTAAAAAAASTASGKPKSTAAKPGTDSKKQRVSADQRYYCVDETRLETLKKEKPWTSSPRYFTNVALSPSAVTKMMMHCASGVEKGTAKGGNPIEGQYNGVLLVFDVSVHFRISHIHSPSSVII